MRLEDVKVGMKVVPHSKSAWCRLENSDTIITMKKLQQKYFYVARVFEDGEISLSELGDGSEGDLFLPSDFEPYVEKKDNKKYLTRDEIRNLPHGTKIKFVDNYTKGRIECGFINQGRRMISEYDHINSCYWYFDNLEEYEVKAWLDEPIQKTQKETLELIFNGTTTIAILKQEDGKYKKGISKLHPLDTYNKSEGIRVAVCKALGEPIKEVKELNDYTIDELLEEIKRRIK